MRRGGPADEIQEPDMIQAAYASALLTERRTEATRRSRRAARPVAAADAPPSTQPATHTLWGRVTAPVLHLVHSRQAWT